MAVPLAYNPLSRWQWEPDKVALALALTGLLLGRALRRGLPALPAARRIGRWRDPEPWIGLYLLARLLSMATSVAPHWSLWGDPAWRNGLLFTAVGAVLFVLARRSLGTSERRERVVTAMLVASVIVAGGGVLQYLFVNHVAGGALVRASSTMAHPNLLAAYLAMVMPLAAARLLAGAPGSRRGWAGALLALQAACLVLTHSRAGWLAALAGLGVMGMGRLWASGRRRMAGLLAACGGLGLAALLLLGWLPPLPGEAPHALQTLTAMFRWQGATAQIRLLGWRAALAAVAERPWLGYGPATFRVVLGWFMPAELAPFGGSSALGGRPHNAFLEVAVESGLVGLACYLAMLGALLAPVAGALVRGDRGGSPTEEGSPKGCPKGRPYKAAVLGAMGANLVVNLFSLESVAPMVLFWSLAGMAHAFPMSEPAGARRGRPRGSPILGGLVAVLGVLVAAWMVAADVMAFVGESVLGKPGLRRESAYVVQLAGDMAPTPEVFLQVEASVYSAWAGETARPGESDALWWRGVDIYDRLVRDRPDVADYWQARGLYLRRWYMAGGGAVRRPDIAREAISSYGEAIRLSPRDPDLWLDRGLVWIDVGDLERALADFQQAGSLLEGYTRYYGAMSIYALAQGDAEVAAAWQARALQAQQEWDAWVWRR